MAGSTRDRSNASIVVIGAGVVGCALAYELTEAGFAPIVLEKGPRIAEGTTSRNSGVIHAGIYYPPGSMKADACIRGKALLYEWCAAHGVPHRRTGKWVVGSKGEETDLLEIYRNAELSGATGLEMHGHGALRSEIPGVKAEIGFFSAETGIVDPYEYSRSLLSAAEARGAHLIANAAVLGIVRLASGAYRLDTSRGEIEADLVINSAGLHADEIAAMAGVSTYKIHPWRGDYFKVKLPRPISQLIYPVKKKNAPGLGVHLTLNLDGSFKLGPDVAWVEDKALFGNPANVEAKQRAFYEAASKYLDGIQLSDLSYDTCGIRPKLRSPEDQAEKDFVIAQDLPGFVNLMGIESPGLTASRDLAQRVAQLL